MASYKKQITLAWYKSFFITTKLHSEEQLSSTKKGPFPSSPGPLFQN